MPLLGRNIRTETVGIPFTAEVAEAQPARTPRASAAPSTVFVELGAAVQKANIARDGVQVPVVTFNPAALGEALEQAGHPVGTEPGQDIDAAFGTLQAAFTFGT